MKQSSYFIFSSATEFIVQIGSAKLKATDPNRELLSTSTYVLHPEFNPDTLENDIGLIKFHMPVTFTGKVISCLKNSS
jgi:hypothetical protein